MHLLLCKGTGVAARGNGHGKRTGLANVIAVVELNSPDWLALASLMAGQWKTLKLARERGARVRYRIERREPGRAWLEVQGKTRPEKQTSTPI
jgi:hypothetical protein